jgi:hypothetical protein
MVILKWWLFYNSPTPNLAFTHHSNTPDTINAIPHYPNTSISISAFTPLNKSPEPIYALTHYLISTVTIYAMIDLTIIIKLDWVYIKTQNFS